ncbi:MAG: FAD binding domain-containing protein [Candidatus Sericytochromatia bacterium]|nr:FAD binding domain-containing protein [Candidatus Sericytochromatia bacterium]
MSFSQPKDLPALLAELAAAPSRPILLAGGTDWMVGNHAHPDKDAHVIDLSRVTVLKVIEPGPDGIRIGAGVTYRQIMEDDRFNPWPMLQEMSRLVGAWQIQVRGTLGGNVANGSPAADSLPVLLAYGAEVELTSVRGTRQVPLGEFYPGYRQTVMAADELITAIWVPRTAPGAVQQYRKVGTRRAQAISKVAFAGYRDGATVRLGMASVGPIVMALPGTCAALLSGADPMAALRADITPIDDVRSTGVYRFFVAENLVRAFAEAMATPSRSQELGT